MAFYKSAAVVAGLLVIAVGLMAQAPAIGDRMAGAAATRNLAYGSDADQKLDVFTPRGASGAAVVVYVHGGGFEGGDKSDYENLMRWLNENGLVGVNVNYRLHPAVSYPAQEQDVAAVVRWLKANVAKHGGDPNRIVLWGHSSGGSVVASYVGTKSVYGEDPGVKGVAALSAPLDMLTWRPAFGYYGRDRATYAANSPQTALLATNVPVLLGVGDNDLPPIRPQQDAAVKVLCAAGKCPQYVVTKGDHMSIVLDVGDRWDPAFTNALLAFVKKVTA